MKREGVISRHKCLAAGAAAALMLAALPAAAQEMSAGSAPEFPDVGDRYDGVGRHMGSFWLFPTLEVGPYYDSNVYARSSDVKSGAGVYITPRLEAKSDWGRHALNIDLNAALFEDFKQSSQSRKNFAGKIDGRIDVQHDFALLGGLKGAYIEEQLGDLNTSIYAADPQPYSEAGAWVSANKTFNRLSVSVGATYELQDYQDVKSTPAFPGYPGKVDQDFRDSNFYEVGGRVSYLFSQGYRWFGDFRYNWLDYQNNSDANSNGWRGLTGVEFELNHLIRGEIGVGYMEQYYDDGSNENGPSYHAGLVWNPTMLMTVRLDANSSFQGSSIEDSNGYIDNQLAIAVDYEVLRGVVLTPSFAMTYENYQDINKSAQTYDFGVKLDYAMSRFMSLGAAYVFTTSSSDDPNLLVDDYNRHVVGIYAKARF